MSIGMTYDEFWNQDVTLVGDYRKAHELKRRQQNEMSYMQGIYFRDAILSTVCNMLADKGSKKFEYPAEPYPVTAEQVAEQEAARYREEEQRLKADMLAMAARMAKRSMPLEAHPAIKGGETNGKSH